MRGNHLSIISLFLALSLLTPTVPAAEFAGGTGEPNDPYLIATAEQLIAVTPIGSSVDGRPVRDLWSRHFVLMADIDLDPNLPGRRVFPGPMLSLTTGSLNGRGHKILNLRIVPDDRGPTWSSNLDAGAIVRNVSFERVVVEGDVGILASVNEGYIANCTVEGSPCGVGLVLENRGYIMGCSITAQAGGDCGLAEKNAGSILFSSVVGGLATDLL